MKPPHLSLRGYEGKEYLEKDINKEKTDYAQTWIVPGWRGQLIDSRQSPGDDCGFFEDQSECVVNAKKEKRYKKIRDVRFKKWLRGEVPHIYEPLTDYLKSVHAMNVCSTVLSVRNCIQLSSLRLYTSLTIHSRSWKEGFFKHGKFLRHLPDGVKPTHIVVGAGSAGCANRLTENPNNRVLLVEAGPQDHWWNWKIHMPAALMYNLRNDYYNWMYFTTPQNNMNGRVLYWPRGRVWGGSSSLNAMVYIRGHPMDYDRWEQEGATGWAYKDCLPYFKKAQTHELATGPDDPYRGHDGPLFVSQGKCEHPLHQAFLESGKQHWLGGTEDMNGYRQEGLGKMDMTIKDGRRWSASSAYLSNILDRPNLFTTTGITCTAVLFNQRRAIGIELIRYQRFMLTEGVDAYSREKIYCEDSVILCAGAINTPQLLMLSGVGPASHLKVHQIPVVQDMQGVGRNLQDHLEIYVQQKCTKPITLYNKSTWRHPHRMAMTGLQWFLTKKGLAATSHLESGGFARSSPEMDHPDLQFHFLPSTVHDDGRQDPKCHAFQVHAGPMRSKSTGEVTLQSNDPRRTLSSFAEPFVSLESFLRRRLLTNSEAKNWLREKNVRLIIRSMLLFAKTLSDPMAVVDPETMNVHGFENLKVVDASLMPSVVSGNLNAPVIMMAEKAADIIAGKGPLPAEQPPLWSPSGLRTE
uniref:Glucose-methanol-choline oxidoreductase N-terminal domain-containing protein n=1 Tax=Globodera rostochiensis TaxID=31243 RepID=A0A914GQK2_GLORO